MKLFLFFLQITVIALTAMWHSAAAQESSEFLKWLNGYKKWAQTQGIKKQVLNKAFEGIKAPRQGSLIADSKQPEFTLSFSDYYQRTVSKQRLKRAQNLGKQHKKLFDKVYAKYKVPASYLIAFWGLESNFGDYTGKVPIIHTLATLAFDLRRREFFEKELLQALKIIQAGDVSPENMQGSWAGAMGQTQFMPSTFTAYAVDGNNDGKRDLWNNLDDTFHSSANFLSQIGWQKNEAWGYEVTLPQDFDYSLSGYKKLKPIKFWKQQGVLLKNKTKLTKLKGKAAVIVPSGHDGPAYLVLKNFRVIMKWNNSVLYALSVGLLAQQIEAKAPSPIQVPASEPLATKTVKLMQQKLTALGYNTHGADGILGSKTKKALQAYQKDNKLPSDGYPSKTVLKSLKLL